MPKFVTWDEIEEAMDAVEDGDRVGICQVYWTFEGRTFWDRDGRGARRTVNVMTFCIHFGLSRGTLSSWLRKYRYVIEPSAMEETA